MREKLVAKDPSNAQSHRGLFYSHIKLSILRARSAEPSQPPPLRESRERPLITTGHSCLYR